MKTGRGHLPAQGEPSPFRAGRRSVNTARLFSIAIRVPATCITSEEPFASAKAGTVFSRGSFLVLYSRVRGCLTDESGRGV